MQMLKVKSPPQSPAHSLHYPRESFFPPPAQAFHRPQSLAKRLSCSSNRAPSIADHLQLGWHDATPPATQSDTPAYVFSTAIAKVESYFPAPDLKIHDSYDTDTLPSSARSTRRLGMNGIASAALRGVSKYHGSVHGTGNHGYSSRSPSRVMHTGAGRTPDQPRSMSTPPRLSRPRLGRPRPSSGSVGFRHGILKRRTKVTNRGEFAIAEDETASARSEAASVLDGDELMKLDEEIRTTMTVSIDEMPDWLEGDEQGGKELSPNVTPFRKGLGPPIKRRSSYWDEDLKEVMSSPARKKVSRRCKGREARSSLMREGFEDGDDEEFVERHRSRFKETVRPRVSFNEEDLREEMERVGEVLKKTLIGCGERDDGLVVKTEMDMDGC